ncbi:agmatine deiminase family protein [Crossiella sp. NPDC003009]
MPPNPLSRRTVLHGLTGLSALALTSACSARDSPASATSPARSPEQAAAPTRQFGAEWEPHARTFMSWPAATAIWGADLSGVRADIARLAQAIAGFEPVVLLARPEQAEAAQRACGKEVEVVPIPVDDLWARDTMPVFVEEGGKVAGVDFHFNGWGGKQPHDRDGKAAAAVLARYGIPGVATPLVGEGGSFETDGQGTLLVTESSMVNDNRNPGMSRDQVEAELKQALGVRKVIWFAGVRGEDITDAHVDSMVRCTPSGTVLLDQAAPGSPPDPWSRAAAQAKEVLREATDADGKPFQVVELPQPDPDLVTGYRDTSVISYVNFYVANGALFLPRFGDRQADDRAQQVLREHFPGREMVPVVINAIATGGGGIHCATHDQPR